MIIRTIFAATSFSFLAAHQAFSALALVENFDDIALGDLTNDSAWTATTAVDVVVDPAGGTNRVVQQGGSGVQQAYLTLAGGGIAQGATGTLFFRMRFANPGNTNIGLSDLGSPGAYSDYESQLSRASDQGGDLRARDGGSFRNLSGGGNPANNVDTWYNVWMVVNNSADTTQIYVQSDDDADFSTQTELTGSEILNFRNGTASNGLQTLYLRGDFGDAFYDDFYIDGSATTLTNPVPEPSIAILGLLGAVVLLRRKRD